MENLSATTGELQGFEDHQALTKIEAGLKMLKARMIAIRGMIEEKLDANQDIMEANREMLTASEEKNEPTGHGHKHRPSYV
jgi:hypothetical protein